MEKKFESKEMLDPHEYEMLNQGIILGRKEYLPGFTEKNFQILLLDHIDLCFKFNELVEKLNSKDIS